MVMKFEWAPIKPRMLQAQLIVLPRGMEVGMSEQDMDPIQQWCEEHRCGTRMSFDIFKFKTDADITMFLLKWG
jgi:hypothetical protein